MLGLRARETEWRPNQGGDVMDEDGGAEKRRRFLRKLHAQLSEGVRRTDPILKEFTGSPAKAASLFAGEVMESEHACAEELSTMRFIG